MLYHRLVSPPTLPKKRWQTCLLSAITSIPTSNYKGKDGSRRRRRNTKQRRNKGVKRKGAGRHVALWSRQMRPSSFDHLFKRDVTVSAGDEEQRNLKQKQIFDEMKRNLFQWPHCDCHRRQRRREKGKEKSENELHLSTTRIQIIYVLKVSWSKLSVDSKWLI